MDGRKKKPATHRWFCFYSAEKNPLTKEILSLEYWLYELQDPIC
jgi:hypothetical protein